MNTKPVKTVEDAPAVEQAPDPTEPLLLTDARMRYYMSSDRHGLSWVARNVDNGLLLKLSIKKQWYN